MSNDITTTPRPISWTPGERQRAIADGYTVNPDVLARYVDAHPDDAAAVIAAPVDTSPDENDGRSPWLWVRFPNGDLMLACFPHGDTYFVGEARREI